MRTCYFFAVIAFALSLAGCKKNNTEVTPLASLNIVNASVNVASVKANFTGANATNYYSAITTSIAYGGNTAFGVLANANVPLTVAPAADTLHPVFSTNLNLDAGSLNTLFLAGQSTSVDTVLVRESIPNYTDSVFGVRFINLNFNSNPISINLIGNANGSEVASLAYKKYSSFKAYNGNAANQTYKFEIRDAATGTLLTTYVFQPSPASPVNPVPRFFNCTLAWIGQTGATGTNAPKIQRINNY